MSLYLTIAGLLIITLSYITTNNNKLMGNSWSIGQESLYATIQNIVVNQINSKQGQMYFPFIYALFMFILTTNLIGLIPYSFASTSHFILTFFLSFTIVLATTILGFQMHKLKFFSLLVPAGCPLALLPLLVFIEFISYFARCISLGLRLAANILAGHTLVHIIVSFILNLTKTDIFLSILFLIPLFLILILEFGVALLQAYVFTVLVCIYLSDTEKLGQH